MADHVVLNGSDHPGRLECMNCGDVYTPAVPCSITTYLAILESFGEQHGDCEYRKENRLGPADHPTDSTSAARGDVRK